MSRAKYNIDVERYKQEYWFFIVLTSCFIAGIFIFISLQPPDVRSVLSDAWPLGILGTVLLLIGLFGLRHKILGGIYAPFRMEYYTNKALAHIFGHEEYQGLTPPFWIGKQAVWWSLGMVFVGIFCLGASLFFYQTAVIGIMTENSKILLNTSVYTDPSVARWLSIGLVLIGMGVMILAVKLSIRSQGIKKLIGIGIKALFVIGAAVAILAAVNRTRCVWQDYQEGFVTEQGQVLQVRYVKSRERILFPRNQCTKTYPHAKSYVLLVQLNDGPQTLTVPESMATKLSPGQQIEVMYYPQMLWVKSITLLSF